MQKQKSTLESFPETVDIGEGSVSNNTGMSQQNSFNNMLNPVASRLSTYEVSPSEASCGNAITRDMQSLNGWNVGEPSSRLNMQNQVNDDGIKMEHGWSSSFGVHAGPGSRSEDRQFEPTNVPFPGRLSIGLSGNQGRNAPLFLQGSSSSHIPQNMNPHAGYVGSGSTTVGAVVGPNLYSSGGLDTERISSSGASFDNAGTSSGSSGYMVEENSGGTSSSLGGWGSSCKRKALEGSSGQSYPGGSSSCFPQSDNDVWHTGPAHYNASSSLTLSTPMQNTPIVSPPEQLNHRIGIVMREVASDAFPCSITGNTEIPLGSFGRRVNPGHQQESLPLNLSSSGTGRRSNVCSPHQSPRPVPFSDSLDLRSTVAAGAAVAANASAAQSPPHSLHVSALSRHAHPFPWNGASNSRAGNGSSSVPSGDRGTAVREEANLRNFPRNNAERPMFPPATEMRNMAQDPTGWTLASGNIGSSGVVPSSISRIGSSSSIHPLPTSAWIPHHPPIHNQHRISEFAPWSLFPSIDAEPGSRGGHFPPLSSGASASSQEAAMPSGSSSQGHHQPYARSAFLLERQGDEALGMPHSLRALAADIEGRHRLISEIRQVLNAMRRGENLRVEDYMLFDPFIYHGMAEMHDRHRDMRLDVDNMSYEELLALEERIGDVSTGLSEETILKFLKQQKYVSVNAESPPDLEPCCICQEEYADGDDLGSLDCGHDFHTNCIKQWLMQKNLCPICKMTALLT